MQKRIKRWLSLLPLAALLCSAAGAAETEQILLPGDMLIRQPESTSVQTIDGVPQLTEHYVLSPEDDPETLRKEPFEQDGIWFRYDHMERAVEMREEAQPAEELVTVEAPSAELADVIDQFPAARTYAKDGYTGELLLDVQSIKVEATGYSTVTDSHPHTVTKNYTLAYNDRSLVPESVQADGLALPLTGLQWSEAQNVEESDVPAAWTATATYSKTTYTTRQVADGYQATARYSGEVSKTVADSIQYVVTYTGSKIPIVPFLPSSISLPQLIAALAAFALLLLALIWRFVRWHMVRIYVYNEERRIHDVVSRQYVRIKSPKIRLSALQGHEETEYTVILRKRLARRLVGRDIAIETGGEGQHHVVESFVGSDYAFAVRI